MHYVSVWLFISFTYEMKFALRLLVVSVLMACDYIIVQIWWSDYLAYVS